MPDHEAATATGRSRAESLADITNSAYWHRAAPNTPRTELATMLDEGAGASVRCVGARRILHRVTLNVRYPALAISNSDSRLHRSDDLPRRHRDAQVASAIPS